MKKILCIIGIVIVLIFGTLIIKELNKDNNKDININIDVLANKLKESYIFEDSLDQIDKDMVINKYNLDSNKIKNLVSYVGTGATAEEILIIEFYNDEDVEQAKDKIEEVLEERKKDFANYLPKEVSKLENHNLERYGKYLILCISNDSNQANKIIKQYVD